MTKELMRLGYTDRIKKARLAGLTSKRAFLVEAVTNHLSTLVVIQPVFDQKWQYHE